MTNDLGLAMRSKRDLSKFGAGMRIAQIKERKMREISS
jgi:hypothetical protein